MSWKVRGSWEAPCSYSDFLCGVDVWIRRPNVVNRKLLGAVVHLEKKVSCSRWSLDLDDGVTPTLGKWLQEEEGGEVSCSVGNESRFMVRELLPRMNHIESSYELVIKDGREKLILFLQLQLPVPYKGMLLDAVVCSEGGYQVMYTASGNRDLPAKISLQVYEQGEPHSQSKPHPLPAINGVTTPTVDWLVEHLMPKVLKWSQESLVEEGAGVGKGSSLILLDKYSCTYKRMKEKYGPSLIKNWPEVTNPHKFVYEDIAIASYLLVLWEEERKALGVEEKQSFVDLGCGNGLLVHLLSSEGHRGKGLDLRERKIWRLYGEKTDLQVCTLTPSPSTVFPGYDWLLGNHSDELTPWLAVMAARSSYTTRYFVLPCCTHDFNRRFHRPGSGRSQYQSYLDYITAIGEKMGFKVRRDTLRIPSSKRTCLIGQQRTYLPHEEAAIDALRQQFLEERCSQGSCSQSPQERVTQGCVHEEEQWGGGFNPRDKDEPVRNCSRVDPKLSQLIVNTIGNHLLQTECLVQIGQACRDDRGGGDSYQFRMKKNQGGDLVSYGQWNVGGSLHLREAIKLFDQSTLTQLKKECGGLQTLLRNHHQVFHVYGGIIHLRNWAAIQSSVGKRASQEAGQVLLKTKLCWFHDNHPQGCPRDPARCPYAHGQVELRKRPDFKTIGNCT